MVGARVLVAEDDAELRRLLGAVLSSWGYEPILVADGSRADEMLAGEEGPSLAILDWMMPGLTGVDVVRRARARANRALRVIVLTARDQPEDTLMALEAGADEYVTKPFDFADLRARLDRLRDDQDTLPTVELVPGLVVGRRWRLDASLGRGGMGEVWRVRHTELGHVAALKTILRERATSAPLRARFELEARAISGLRSPYIAQTYDYGTTPDGRPFLVMELVDGVSLEASVRASGRAPMHMVGVIVPQVARALTHVHEHGVVHRDVKPANIVLETMGDDSLAGVPIRAKLIDFGVVQLSKRAGPRMTAEGMAVGTPGYASPEQLRGAATGPTADVWALGAVAYFMATGRAPFAEESRAATIHATLEGPFPTPSRVMPSVGEAFDRWVARACAMRPQDRFATAAEASQALRELLRTPRHEGEPSGWSIPDRSGGEGPTGTAVTAPATPAPEGPAGSRGK